MYYTNMAAIPLTPEAIFLCFRSADSFSTCVVLFVYIQ